MTSTEFHNPAADTPFPGVHRLRVPLTGSPLGHLNAYLLPSSQGHMLIDTGWNREDAFQSLDGQMAGLGLKMRDISLIVITHLHLDHFGLADRVRRASGASVGVYRIESRLVELRYQRVDEYARLSSEMLRRGGVESEFARTPEEIVEKLRKLSAPLEPDFLLEDGQVLEHGGFSLRAVWTPGHSPGHICLYEPDKRLLFAGDHVLENITPNIGLFPHSGENPLADYLASLERMDGLGVDLVLPAHGGPFRGLARRVGSIREHHAFRNQEIMELVRNADGGQTPFDLAMRITWHAGGRPSGWLDLPMWDKRLAVFEIMSHLEALHREGALERHEKKGVSFYYPA